MSNDLTPPPDVIRTLLRLPFDRAAVHATLRRPDVARWLTGIATSLWRRNSNFRKTISQEDFAADLLNLLVLRLMTRAATPDELEPAAYIAGMLKNLAKDEWRRRAAKKRGGGQVDAEFNEDTDGRLESRALEHLDARQRVAGVIDTARRSGLLTAGGRAVFVAMVAPSVVEVGEVAEAGKSFAREPEATIALMERRLVNELPPVLDEDSEHTFVWIAKCPDGEDITESWHTWRAHDARAARTALDTIQRSFRRAKDKVLGALLSEGGEA